MGVYAGPDVVENGLVLALDAGNPKSYPGSGTTWTDLSGRGNNGTLTNGPTYSSANGGSLSFDGVDDYVNCGNNTVLSPAELTLFCFVYPKSTRPEELIAINMGPFGEGAGFRFMTRTYKGNTGTKWGFWPTPDTGTEWEASVLSNNTWYCLSVTYTPTNLKLYKNAVIELDTGSPGNIGYGGDLNLGIGVLGAQGYLNANLPIFMMYNRALTASEIRQNFNATKSRYGL